MIAGTCGGQVMNGHSSAAWSRSGSAGTGSPLPTQVTVSPWAGATKRPTTYRRSTILFSRNGAHRFVCSDCSVESAHHGMRPCRFVQPWPGPRRSAEAEAERRGRDRFVVACAELVVGIGVDDPALIYALGGPPARWALTGEPPGPDYWLRTWALRGLLWVWEDGATEAVLVGLRDEHWRVREMAARVVARHRVDEALERVVVIQADPVIRVRKAADRAVRTLTTPPT